MDFSTFEREIGVSFKDKKLLKQAFTHRSYINEHKNSGLEHNERLEFLGDAVLELIVTEYLFHNYPNQNEGEMTSFRSALVNSNTLSKVASDLAMNDYILLSRGEAKDNNGRARAYILADAFEALVGAIFIDQGYNVVREFVSKNIFGLAEAIIKEGLWVDSKSLFQEKAQEKSGVTPAYYTLSEEGPDHDKSFTVGVYLGDKKVAEGRGKSKQDAEQEAAKEGLKEMKWD
jgi:ribonuclease III